MKQIDCISLFVTLKFCLSQRTFIGKSNLYQKRYSLALLLHWRFYNIWHASHNLQDSWQDLRNYTFVLVFFRNQVFKVWPLVSNHRLSDEKWIQLSAGGAKIFNVKNTRISESPMACTHGCPIWVGSLSNLGRKVYFLTAQSFDCQVTYNSYSFFTWGWAIIFSCTLYKLTGEHIIKDLRCLTFLDCFKKKSQRLLLEVIQDTFKIFVGHWTWENILLCLLS